MIDLLLFYFYDKMAERRYPKGAYYEPDADGAERDLKNMVEQLEREQKEERDLAEQRNVVSRALNNVLQDS